MKIVRKVSKSVYPIRYPIKGSFNLGEICPIGAPLEVIPGDYFKLEAAMALRMATPIAPIMDDLDAEITAHFVPLRLISGARGDSTGNTLGTPIIDNPKFEAIIGNGVGNPVDWMQTNHELYSAPTEGFNEYTAKTANYTTIGEALGLGLGTTGADLGAKQYLAYPLYGYNLIYQHRFRNENVEAGRPYNQTSNVNGYWGSNIATADSNPPAYNAALNVAYKHGDLITNCTPNVQKGGPVEIPMAGLAPLGVKGTTYTVGDLEGGNNHDIMLGNSSSLAANIVSNASDVLIEGSSYTPTGTEAGLTQTNLYADLSQATAATIQQFVTAYNIQQLLMRDMKGTRYYELILNHYSIKNEDIKLYVPELLMYRRFAINISPVVQQSGAASGAGSQTQQNNILGTTGGYSFTGNKGNMVHHAFGEFGYIYFLIVIRHRRTYGQGVPKLFLRSTRFDWFFPELGRIGFDKVTKERLNASERANKDQVYGYCPAWQELRERGFAQVFGFMNPVKSNSLEYWDLAERYTSTPTLSISWLKEDRSNLQDALTIGATGPDFIMDAMIYGSVSTFVPIGTEPKLFD